MEAVKPPATALTFPPSLPLALPLGGEGAESEAGQAGGRLPGAGRRLCRARVRPHQVCATFQSCSYDQRECLCV